MHCGRRCYRRPPGLLHTAAGAATDAAQVCYTRRPRLLPTPTVSATHGGRCCYRRWPVLLHQAARAATRGGRGWYRRWPGLLHLAAWSATHDGRVCYRRLPCLLHTAYGEAETHQRYCFWASAVLRVCVEAPVSSPATGGAHGGGTEVVLYCCKESGHRSSGDAFSSNRRSSWRSNGAWCGTAASRRWPAVLHGFRRSSPAMVGDATLVNGACYHGEWRLLL